MGFYYDGFVKCATKYGPTIRTVNILIGITILAQINGMKLYVMYNKRVGVFYHNIKHDA